MYIHSTLYITLIYTMTIDYYTVIITLYIGECNCFITREPQDPRAAPTSPCPRLAIGFRAPQGHINLFFGR